jgi:hypothetical protein
LFLVDGKLVMLHPKATDTGDVKYDMKVLSQNVEFYVLMRDTEPESELTRSLWVFDGHELSTWQNISQQVYEPSSSMICDSYPLAVMTAKGLVLGIESELLQRRNMPTTFRRITRVRFHDGLDF